MSDRPVPDSALSAFLRTAMEPSSLLQAEAEEAAFELGAVDHFSTAITTILQRAGFSFSTDPFEPDCSMLLSKTGLMSLVVIHPVAGSEACFRSFHLTISTDEISARTLQIHALTEAIELDFPDETGGSWEGYLDSADGLSMYIEPLVMEIFPETASRMLMLRHSENARRPQGAVPSP